MGMCAAQILALSALDIIEKPVLLKTAWEEFKERKAQHDEPPLLPDGLKPPVEPGDEWWIPPQ